MSTPSIDTSDFSAGTTWVIKIGSSLLTKNGSGLALDLIESWVEQIVALHRAGIKVVIVSSGAVAEGMSRLNMTLRPSSIQLLQAAAAVGQMGLVQAYESQFQKYGLHTAQILLTHEDLKSRERYINARGTLNSLLTLDVIPVVNENDTVVTDEIRFGDNDSLAALVANLIDAETLLLLTDQDGLFDADPRSNPNATLITGSMVNNPDLLAMAGEGGELGRGGMITKLLAAKTAARSGANTVIANGMADNVIQQLQQGVVMGTLLLAGQETLVSRKQWLAALQPRGTLTLDDGAVRVLKKEGRSLLPVGVKSVKGKFTRGELVACIDIQGNHIAKGLINYSTEEATAICGCSSSEIKRILGYEGEQELIHRDNMVIV